MERSEEGKRRRREGRVGVGCGVAGSSVSGSRAVEEKEIEAIGSFIAARRGRLQPEEEEERREASRAVPPPPGSVGKGRKASGSGRRDHFTCILCVAFKFHNVFTRRNSEIKVGELNYNELFIRFALSTLAKVYKRNYYKAGVNSEIPRIYPTFDFPGGGGGTGSGGPQRPTGGEGLLFPLVCRVDRILAGSDSEFSLVLGQSPREGAAAGGGKAGLHLSLTRTHHLSRRLSRGFLGGVVRRLNNCQTSFFQVPEKPPPPGPHRGVELRVKLRPFPIFLDYGSVLILENASLHSKDSRVNGGVFAAVQIHKASKQAYLDPIIEVVNQACADLGIPPLCSEKALLHVSLFYIKRSDLHLERAGKGSDTGHQSSSHVLQVHSLKHECLPSLRTPPPDEPDSARLLPDLAGNNMIWVNHLVFRIGICEYYLLFDS